MASGPLPVSSISLKTVLASLPLMVPSSTNRTMRARSAASTGQLSMRSAVSSLLSLSTRKRSPMSQFAMALGLAWALTAASKYSATSRRWVRMSAS